MSTNPTHHDPRITLINLTRAEIRKMVKPHAGFENHVEALVELYETRRDALGRGSLDGRSLLDALAAYIDLGREEDLARAHLDRIRQTRLKLSSTVWSGMLEIYARAVAASRSDLTIARAIEDFRRYMKHAPRKKPVVPG